MFCFGDVNTFHQKSHSSYIEASFILAYTIALASGVAPALHLSLIDSREKPLVLSITKTLETHLTLSLSPVWCSPSHFSIAITLVTALHNLEIEYQSSYHDLIELVTL